MSFVRFLIVPFQCEVLYNGPSLVIGVVVNKINSLSFQILVCCWLSAFLLGVGFIYGFGLATGATWLSLNYGDVPTWLAAIGTIGTLLFAVVQNHKLVKRQDQTERLQAKLWEKQLKSLNFQEYQSHISEFNVMLESIESELPTAIEFRNKKSFYQSIFNKNSRDNVEYELSEITNNHPISTIERELESHLKCIIDFSERKHDSSLGLLLSYVQLFDRMRLSTGSNCRFADVKISNGVTLNIFELNDLTFSLHRAYNKVRSFCQLESYQTEQNAFIDGGDLTERILHFYASDPNSNTIIVNFGHYNLLKILSSSILIAREFELSDKKLVDLLHITGFMRGTTIKNPQDTAEVKLYLSTLADTFRELEVSNNQIAGHITFIEESINN